MARTGARATVRGAIIAVVAGVVGALIAGYFTLSTADRQIAAAQDQARTDFLRTQQQSAYATYLQDALALRQAEVDYADLVDSGANPTAVQAAAAKINAAYNKIYDDQSNVLLVASGRVVIAATDFSESHRIADSAVFGPAAQPFTKQTAAKVRAIANNTDPQTQFLLAARQDLGNNY